eukprot:807596-Pyramimonas_sp.AAC.1
MSPRGFRRSPGPPERLPSCLERRPKRPRLFGRWLKSALRWLSDEPRALEDSPRLLLDGRKGTQD